MVSNEVVGDIFFVGDELFRVEELFNCASNFIDDGGLEIYIEICNTICGLPNEDPYAHLATYIEICNTI